MDKFLNKTSAGPEVAGKITTTPNTDENCSFGDDTVELPQSKRSRPFLNAWLSDPSLQGWLTKKKMANDVFEAYCDVCNCALRAKSGKTDLLQHGRSYKHLQASRRIKSLQKVDELFRVASDTKITVKQAEVKLCAFVAEHNLPFQAMDHLTKCIKSCFKDSKIADEVSCCRTKATAIVKNVLGQYQFRYICKILRENKFSICIDESTDFTNKKQLSIVVRVCNDCKVQDFFFGLIAVVKCDAQSLFLCIQDYFVKNGIDYKNNMIGFAADGANNMTGQNHSVAKLFKNEIPNLCIFKCICHSIALCSSYACLKLPSEVESLVRDIYNYVSNSPKRGEQLQAILSLLEYKPRKLLHPCQTRWLSLEAVVTRVLELYEPLKIFFSFAVKVDHIDNAKTILENLNIRNELYLSFLKYILKIINKANKTFQSESSQIINMYSDMKKLFLTVIDNFVNQNYVADDINQIDYKNNDSHLNSNEIYLGVYVKEILSKSKISESDIKIFVRNCVSFYIEMCDQIKKRFDFNNPLFQALASVHPHNILTKQSNSLYELATVFPNLISKEDYQALDIEYRELRCLDFDCIIDKTQPCTMEYFWSTVFSIKLCDKSMAFPVLSKFMQSIMCLPHSSANVERIFSKINLNKTKQRNSLENSTLEGILFTQDLLKVNDCPCFELRPNSDLLKGFSKEMYI